MLKRRLIPRLQVVARPLGGRLRLVLVTTIRFGDRIEIGDPVSQARIYEAQATDELVLLDIRPDAAHRGAFTDLVADVAGEVFMPLTVGGGVSTMDDVRRLLANGADKVALNTGAVADPALLSLAAEAFGVQCVVLSIDVRDGRVHTHGGSVDTGLDPVAWAAEGVRRGAGEVLLTCVDRDGTRSGLDLDLVRRVADAVAVPVIAGGGCGVASDFTAGFVEGGADGVASGTYFSFRDENPMQTRSHIANAGVPIRLHT